MISLFKKRPWITAATILVAAVCGAGIGCLMGSVITLRLATGKLQQYSMRILEKDVASSEEARTVLHQLNASNLPHCSDAELHYFRDLIYMAEYLRDAGSIRDGKVDCSANMGRLPQALPLPKPKFIQHDGILVYQNLSPPDLLHVRNIGLQLGNSYVVFNGYNFTQVKLPSMHFFTTESDQSNSQTGPLTGEALRAQGMVVTQDHSGRSGNTFYATHCSIAYSDCVTAYLTIPEALQNDRSVIAGYMVLGGLFGVFFGLYCSNVYQHSRGMESQLRRAVREDKLQMVYQPIVELGSGHIVGAETLARWTDEEGIAVGPDVFVRLAEERGFVGPITQLVVHHALQDFAATLRANPGFHISVNVAAADLADPGFLPMLERELALAEVPARSLTIEITESSTARHDVAINTIMALRGRGHSVHIDDFGTGYSSLSYLQDLAVDAIKIDRTFTRAVGTGAANAAILPKILGMAEALSLKVIVEGIEVESQAAYFSSTGQPMLAQGWLFGQPLQIEEFRQRLAENEKEALLKPPVAWQGKLFSEDESPSARIA